MNRTDRNRLNEVTREVDGLLGAGPVKDSRITNIVVLEAFLADVKAIANGRKPTEVHALVLEEVDNLKKELEVLSS